MTLTIPVWALWTLGICGGFVTMVLAVFGALVLWFFKDFKINY